MDTANKCATVRIDSQTHGLLRRLAYERHSYISAIIREAVKKYAAKPYSEKKGK